MAKKTKLLQAKNPLILRSQRLMEAFAKSDDERDFYLDRQEGFIIYFNLDESEENIQSLEAELSANSERYCMIPKLSFYEQKKIMEGFIHEKVYDIDTKEKLMDIIQSKEARENFLEFLYDHHTELEKWQQYYQERSRVRIIEWLRQNHFHFVFEEDLGLGVANIESLKKNLFEEKAPKEVQNARKILATKAKSYYSNEALNPRPKRGRPPKQVQKTELEPQITVDIYSTVPKKVLPFLFTPDLSHIGAASFSSKFETEEEILAHRKQSMKEESENALENLNQKLATLRKLSTKWNNNKSSEVDLSKVDDDDDEKEDKKVKKSKAQSAKKEAKSETKRREKS
ncbi:MAG: hypothetical protein K940chlam3_00349 [Chlamydiae bacterium]|nr:hypothetical protein [Chlamydiota bacterium]